MKSFADIEARIEAIAAQPGNTPDREHGCVAAELLGLGEECLEHWIAARGEEPTGEKKEGFRLLALHRQGAKGDPSFNACRETCRELVYHYNLISLDPAHAESGQRLRMAAMVARHLCYFIGGKMQAAELGEFCCSSKPLRSTGT